MSNRWAPGPRARWLIGAIAVVLLLVIVWALLVPGADWLARHDVGSAKGSLAAARDAARGRLLTLGAGLLATGALLFTARNFTLSRRTFELTEQGQVTDRYTKAIEQLGSDKLDVRVTFSRNGWPDLQCARFPSQSCANTARRRAPRALRSERPRSRSRSLSHRWGAQHDPHRPR